MSGRTLAQQAIEQSLIEAADETDRTGRPRTLAQQAQDQDGRELKRAKATWCPFCKKAHVGGDTCMGHFP